MGEDNTKPAYTVQRRTAHVFEFHIGLDYAVFTLDVQDQRNYYGLAIESSYGGYSYAWSAPGNSFFGFLAHLNIDYVRGKMTGGEREVFDGDAVREELAKEMKRMLEAGECSQEEFDDENELIGAMESELDFADWSRGTVLFKDADPYHDYYRTAGGMRFNDFTHLYEKFWPALAIELTKAEKADESKREADPQESATGA